MTVQVADGGPAKTVPVRVMLVDDHTLFRQALTDLLARADGVEVVAATGNADEAVHAVQTANPDVVLLDLELGAGRTTDVIGQMKASRPIPVSPGTVAVPRLRPHGRPSGRGKGRRLSRACRI